MGQSLLHRRACITRKAPLLQSGMGITNWGKSYFKVGQVIYYKVGQSLLSSEASAIKWGSFITSGAGTKKRPVHLCDNRTNGDSCLLTGKMQFGNGVLMEFYLMQCPLHGLNPIRKIHIFARAHTTYAFTLKRYATLRIAHNI